MNPDFERRRLGTAKIGIVTITDDEYSRALEIFQATNPLTGTPYTIASDEDAASPHVVVCQAGSRSNLPAAQIVSRLLEAWRPEFVFLTGTAGGVKKTEGKEREQLRLGDIVVADYIDYVEFAKLTGGKILPRKIAYDHPSPHLRANFVNHLKMRSEWQQHIKAARPPEPAEAAKPADPAKAAEPAKPAEPAIAGDNGPRIHIGNVAAGEKIFADYAGKHQKQLLGIFDKVIAFEMESYGVAKTLYEARCSVNYNPQFLTIRGVSDFVNVPGSNADRDAWTDYAASVALAFARSLADQLRTYFADREAYGASS